MKQYVSSRRNFLRLLAAMPFAGLLTPAIASKNTSKSIIKPPRLRAGATVGLINPASFTHDPEDLEVVKETLASLGLKVKVGQHTLDRYGYLAGTDANRAADVNAMFRDKSVDAIFAVRGGWGCNRILPLLDYKMIRKNPKIIMGYSDIASLLLAIHARTGLITFHGPVATSTWNDFSLKYVRSVLFDGATPTFTNPPKPEDSLAKTKDRIVSITGGKATGRLLGGNLSVLSAMVGSDYLPDWKDNILFLEEVDENIYRVDRMLTQLKLAGILDDIGGFVFGKCTDCGPGRTYGSLTFGQVLEDHIAPLGIPAMSGAMIGHITDKFTIPLGVKAEIDASAGTIRMLEPAVS